LEALRFQAHFVRSGHLQLDIVFGRKLGVLPFKD
jgi:hypothetical protein